MNESKEMHTGTDIYMKTEENVRKNKEDLLVDIRDKSLEIETHIEREDEK